MPAPRPIPAALRSGPFTPADARALGVRADMLRGTRVESPFYGVHQMADGVPTLLLVLGGLPYPDVNRDVVVDGEWIARPDLSYPAARLAIEYEGDHHRTDRRQWRSDKRRRRLLKDAGWLVIEVTADDVFRHADELIARVRIALLRRI